MHFLGNMDVIFILSTKQHIYAYIYSFPNLWLANLSPFFVILQPIIFFPCNCQCIQCLKYSGFSQGNLFESRIYYYSILKTKVRVVYTVWSELESKLTLQDSLIMSAGLKKQYPWRYYLQKSKHKSSDTKHPLI